MGKSLGEVGAAVVGLLFIGVSVVGIYQAATAGERHRLQEEEEQRQRRYDAAESRALRYSQFMRAQAEAAKAGVPFDELQASERDFREQMRSEELIEALREKE